jgi:hypothetical protein
LNIYEKQKGESRKGRMTAKELGNQTAFPSPLTGQWAGTGTNAKYAPDSTEGMTLRAWFAGMASASVAAGVLCSVEGSVESPEAYAKTCCRMADAMLAELAKEQL